MKKKPASIDRFCSNACDQIEYNDFLKGLGHGFDMLLIFTLCSRPGQQVMDMNYGYFCFSDFSDFKNLVISQVIIGFNSMYIRYANRDANKVDGSTENGGVGKEGSQQWRWGKVDFAFNGSEVIRAGFDKSITVLDVEFYMYRKERHYVISYKKINKNQGNYDVADMEQNKLYNTIRSVTRTSRRNKGLYKNEMDRIKCLVKEFEPSKDDCSRACLEYVYTSRTFQSFKTEGIQCPDIEQTFEFYSKKHKKKAEAERAALQDENSIATGTH